MGIEEIRNLIKPCDEKKPYVFVSYSKLDKEIVYPMIIHLQSQGVNLWIDKELDNQAGKDWREKAFNAIVKSNCIKLLFFMSTHSFMSIPVLAELNYTMNRKTMLNHVNKKVEIIPITIDKDKKNLGGVIEDCSNEEEYGICISDPINHDKGKGLEKFLPCLSAEEIKNKDVDDTFEYGGLITYTFEKVWNLNGEVTVVGDVNGVLGAENITKAINQEKFDIDLNKIYDLVSQKENLNKDSSKNLSSLDENNEEKEIVEKKEIVENKESNIKKDIKNILPEIINEISSGGKDVYTIDQKGEPHFYTKRMDKYLSNDNKVKSVWGDDNLYRYEFKTLTDKIGIRMTPSSTNASKETIEKMKKLHKLECVKGEGVNDNLKEDFIYGCVFYKKYGFNENINNEEKKELIKTCVLYALDIEQKIFNEIDGKVTSDNKNCKQKDIRENNSKPFNSDLTDEYINLHKNDADILEKETSAEKLYIEFSDNFSPEKLKELNGINLLRKIFLNDEGTQDNICSILEYSKDYVQFGSIKGGTALKHCLYYSAKDKSWKTGKPPVDVKNVTEEEAIAIGTKIRDNIIKACGIIERNRENLKTENDYKKLYEEISRDCDNVHKIIFVKKYFHMIYKDLFPCMFSGGYIRKVAEALNFENGLDDFAYIGKIEEMKNKFGISNRIFAEIVYKYFDEENYKYQSC